MSHATAHEKSHFSTTHEPQKQRKSQTNIELNYGPETAAVVLIERVTVRGRELQELEAVAEEAYNELSRAREVAHIARRLRLNAIATGVEAVRDASAHKCSRYGGIVCLSRL